MSRLSSAFHPSGLARRLLLATVLSTTWLCAMAQQGASRDPLDTGPRGLTEVTAPATATAAPASKPVTPANPAGDAAGEPPVFGSQVFGGRFAAQSFTGYNADYQIASGDRIALRMWGAFTFDAALTVDAQGNVFVPNVGPVSVRGVRNGELQAIFATAVARTFRSNVGVYASLEAAQPVKVYVTGDVRAPGLYPGMSSDSVLRFLDQAGGIDPQRGSFLAIDIRRGGELRTTVNLYDFLLEGRLPALQFRDGDTVFVRPRQHTVAVAGEVHNAYRFEFASPEIDTTRLLALARPKPGATHLSIVRTQGREKRSEYHPLAQAASTQLRDGDMVAVSADRVPGTILVRVEGAQLGERSLVLPYGARLSDVLPKLRPAPQAAVEHLQLFRRSVAQQQKDMLEASLRGLETYALTARSATSEEAALRERESRQILEFIGRARQVEPRGQVVLAQGSDNSSLLMEDGDVLRLPERSDIVVVGGEVLFPSALAFDAGADASTYVQRAGGFTQGADQARMVLMRQDGSVVMATSAVPVRAGDQLLVLPRIETKDVEVTRGITQIVYQIAVAAKVLFGL
ncbi:MAG: polysaccharide export protein [Burkholderiaceae bacterium]|nr:polysaccharide export protein [Rhodoferax sp.]MCP5285807.1 polysaccharide export protein [Burkholderiaceae bacterium]